MSDILKIGINMLQYHIDRSSDNVLLIFDNGMSVDRYKKYVTKLISKNMIPEDYWDKTICVTIEDLYRPHGLTGRKFRSYRFILEEEIRYEN